MGFFLPRPPSFPRCPGIPFRLLRFGFHKLAGQGFRFQGREVQAAGVFVALGGPAPCPAFHRRVGCLLLDFCRLPTWELEGPPRRPAPSRKGRRPVAELFQPFSHVHTVRIQRQLAKYQRLRFLAAPLVTILLSLPGLGANRLNFDRLVNQKEQKYLDDLALVNDTPPPGMGTVDGRKKGLLCGTPNGVPANRTNRQDPY
jgi:hypothetical protein